MFHGIWNNPGGGIHRVSSQTMILAWCSPSLPPSHRRSLSIPRHQQLHNPHPPLRFGRAELCLNQSFHTLQPGLRDKWCHRRPASAKAPPTHRSGLPLQIRPSKSDRWSNHLPWTPLSFLDRLMHDMIGGLVREGQVRLEVSHCVLFFSLRFCTAYTSSTFMHCIAYDYQTWLRQLRRKLASFPSNHAYLVYLV